MIEMQEDILSKRCNNYKFGIFGLTLASREEKEYASGVESESNSRKTLPNQY